MNGYCGKILKVDLTSGRIVTENLDPKAAREYIGGSGLGIKYLYEMSNGETDPLGPENPLIFMTGPLTGTKVFSSNRFQVITKSPQTGIFGEANCGGHWGAVLKKSGFDGIIITGKAGNPARLVIHDGEAEIVDADDLWGLDTFETDDRLCEITVGKSESVYIGPAGEKLVKYSAVSTSGAHTRVAGRAGCGAVMGSKNLKAITVSGEQKAPIHDEAGLKEYVKKRSKEVSQHPVSVLLRDLGTACGMLGGVPIGNTPIKNWSDIKFDTAENIDGTTMSKSILTGKYYCGSCVVGCGRKIEVKEGPYKTDGEVGGPEYESVALLGSNLLIDDLEAVCKLNELCNRYGMDTISAGSSIGMAMECYEKGLMTQDDLDGIDLKWGDPEAAIKMLEKISERDGIGRLLGEGVKAIGEHVGGGAEKFAPHVKGLEFAAHDPRAKVGTALAYMTSARGACHMSAGTSNYESCFEMEDLGFPESPDRLEVEGKANFVVQFQNFHGMFDTVPCCKFMAHQSITLKPITEALELITGMGIDETEFLEIGERIFNLKRLYNINCGMTRADDCLPERFSRKTIDGEEEIHVFPDYDRLLDEFYHLRGWDERGIPTSEKLEQLKLS